MMKQKEQVQDTEALKQRAAQKAVILVESGMVIGLGSGSTSQKAIDLIGEALKSGRLRDIVGIPTSNATAKQAKALGIPLGDLADHSHLDIAIDGADEITPDLNLMKGWGGALVREKLVEIYAERFVIIAHGAKLVNKLGLSGPLPVEVTQFAWQSQAQWLAKTLGCEVERRQDQGRPFLSDNQNFVLHCHFQSGIEDPMWVQACLANRPGIVGHGLFLNMATDAIIAKDNETLHLRR